MSEIKITVQGPVGSGKSALLGEIEILCKALGVPVRYADPSDAASEKSMTHADWTAYLEMYKPSVVLHEKGSDRAALASAPVAGAAQLPWHLPVQHWTDEEKANLLAAPQASEAVRDAARLNWLLRHIPGDAIRRAVGVLSDTSDVGEFRQAIDAALSAQPGAQKGEPTSE